MGSLTGRAGTVFYDNRPGFRLLPYGDRGRGQTQNCIQRGARDIMFIANWELRAHAAPVDKVLSRLHKHDLSIKIRKVHLLHLLVLGMILTS